MKKTNNKKLVNLLFALSSVFGVCYYIIYAYPELINGFTFVLGFSIILIVSVIILTLLSIKKALFLPAFLIVEYANKTYMSINNEEFVSMFCSLIPLVLLLIASFKKTKKSMIISTILCIVNFIVFAAFEICGISVLFGKFIIGTHLEGFPALVLSIISMIVCCFKYDKLKNEDDMLKPIETEEHIGQINVSDLLKYKELLDNELITQEEYDEKKVEYLSSDVETFIKDNKSENLEKSSKKFFTRKLALAGIILIIIGIIGGGYNLKEANYYRGRALSYNASDEYKEKGIYGSRVGIEQASGYVNLYDAYSYYNANNKYNEKIEKQRYYRNKENTYKKYSYAFFGVSVLGVVLIIVDKRKASGKGKLKVQITKS